MRGVFASLGSQREWCRRNGSPFLAQLLERAEEDLRQGGVLREVCAPWTGRVTPDDAFALRLAGALHHLALSGRHPALAAAYPQADAAWDMARLWPLAGAALASELAQVIAFMRSPPQTNETNRAGGLAPAFLYLAERGAPEPFHFLELGASAGLNLHWDRFRYAYRPWGRDSGPGPRVSTEVEGDLPPWRPLAIASRRGCDQAPVDPSDPADRLRLRSYVWADQRERLARLDAALDLAAASEVRVERADAAAWIAARLAGELPRGTTVVYHSVFFQYPPPATRAAIADAIADAGARASAERRLAWVRFEPADTWRSPKGDASASAMQVDVVCWEGARWEGQAAQRTLLGEVHAHGHSLTWRPRPASL